MAAGLTFKGRDGSASGEHSLNKRRECLPRLIRPPSAGAGAAVWLLLGVGWLFATFAAAAPAVDLCSVCPGSVAFTTPPAHGMATLNAAPSGMARGTLNRVKGPARRLDQAPVLGKGVFLVASRRLRDPNFNKTVVLIVAHGEDGALGVVLNRPTPMRLAALLPDMEGLGDREERVFIGGPVAIERVTLLLRAASPPVDSLRVFGEVYFSGSVTTLEQALSEEPPVSGMQAYAGHAGWGPGQLEDEVQRGDWYVAKPDAAIVFSEAPEKLWRQLIDVQSGVWVRNSSPLWGRSTRLHRASVVPRT
jgi:putative transcriptional regulator